MISSQQRTLLLLLALVLRSSCHPTQVAVTARSLKTAAAKEDITARRAKEDLEVDEFVDSQALVTPRDGHDVHWYKKGVIIRQLLPFLFSAFMNSVTAVMFNWFFPWKVIPPIPGRLGLGQLFGGFLPKHEPYYPAPYPFVGRR